MRMLLYITLLAINYFLFAQQIIRGKVISKDTGEELIGAHVYLLDDWRNGAITGIDGEFTLSVDSLVGASIVITFVGFEEQLLEASANMIIRMTPLAVLAKEVVVTAKPLIAEEFKYIEIKKIDIYTNPSAKADPLLAVNSLPSATTTDESANISLRGSSPLETGIFLNNVPVYDAVRYSQLNGIGTFSIFNTAFIKNVTVFPGNPPLEFGNVTSGIVSMEMDDRVLEGNTNSAVVSLANIGFSREQRISNKQSIKLFSNWQPSGPIKSINEKALEDIKRFTSNDLGIYWYGGESLTWKVLSYSVTEGYQFNFEHPSFSGIFDQKKQRSYLITSLETPLGAGFIGLNNGLSFSRGKFKYSNAAFDVKKKDFFLGANYLFSKPTYSIKTGVSYDARSSSVAGNFHEYFYALGSDHPTIELDEATQIQVLEGFGYFKYFLTEHIAFGTGFRKNVPVGNVDSYLSSQANASFTNGSWTVTFGIGTYHKNGFVENSGEPFESESYQKAIDVRKSIKQFEIAMSLFDKAGKLNGSSYEARGLELFTNYQITSKLRASGSITLLDASNDPDDYIYDLSYFVRGNLSYSPGRLWTIESTLVARQGTSFIEVINANFDNLLGVFEPQFADNLTRLNNYSNIGLAVSKIFTISEKMNVIAFASLNNVLDRKNVRNYAYNFDYSGFDENYYSERTGYVGAVINF